MQNKSFNILLFFLLVTTAVFSQQDGYWDKARATTEEISVSARDRIVIKTQDFPEGTTEIVFRITLLDKNQQMAGSLVSVLKAIPDPTGISQGSAGAVFLLSKISGEDKCKYAVFSAANLAAKYQLDGSTASACFVNDTPVSKDAKRFSAGKSSCLKSNTTNLWFGFESKNWVMSQKIILEVVPWVDNKLSRGWNIANKKQIIEQCKTSTMAQKMFNSDDFCVCVLNKIQANYKSKEFQKLLPMERAKAFKDYGDSCFSEKNLSSAAQDDLREQSILLTKNGKYAEAITKSLQIINEGKATAIDYNFIGANYIITKQYAKAIKYLLEGEKLDDSELLIKLNLANAYLLNGNYSNAKPIYKKFRNQNVTENQSWCDKVKLDIAAYRKLGIQNDDFEKVLRLNQN